MSEPTKEQIWFWEQCGLGCVHDWQVLDKTPLWGLDCVRCGQEFRKSQWSQAKAPVVGDFTEYPLIDLNNLFKYAVPVVIKSNDYFMLRYDRHNNEWYCQVGLSSSRAKDPALALFWAIYKAFGGKEL